MANGESTCKVAALLIFLMALPPLSAQAYKSGVLERDRLQLTLKTLNVFVEDSGGATRPCEVAGQVVDLSGRDWAAVKFQVSVGDNLATGPQDAVIALDEISDGEAQYFDADVAGGCHGEGRISNLQGTVSVVEAVPLAQVFSRLSEDGRSFVASDPQCFSDYLAAIKAGGLEMRKKIAELITYDCGYVEDPGTYVTVLSETSDSAHVEIEHGPHKGASGWVSKSSVVKRQN
jgi:hypothetical protein